jgi:hypothetical protein
MYQIIDGQTGEQVKVCKTLRSASRACDKLDNDYGAVRYSFRRIETPKQAPQASQESN